MYLASWSGGKDSCLACYKAIKQGTRIDCLLNFITREHKRGCFHGIESSLLKQQAEAIGIPIIQKEVSPDMSEYEKEFKEGVLSVIAKSQAAKQSDPRSVQGGASCQTAAACGNGMVFGDIYLDEHKEWVERVCRDLNIRCIEPLWNMPPENVVEEFISAGFKAVVVSAKADLFGKDFVGRLVDKALVNELKSRKICPCGENGEFHTFVFDGPNFKKSIRITESQPVLKEGFWKHWFLDIQKWEVIDK